MCMKATQTNMEKSERDTEEGNSKEKDSERRAASLAWMWFGYEKSDADQKTVLCKLWRIQLNLQLMCYAKICISMWI